MKPHPNDSTILRLCISVYFATADFNGDICTVVAIYHSIFNAGTKTKNDVDDEDPRHVNDIGKYHKNIKNIAAKDRISNTSVAGNVKKVKMKYSDACM